MFINIIHMGTKSGFKPYVLQQWQTSNDIRHDDEQCSRGQDTRTNTEHTCTDSQLKYIKEREKRGTRQQNKLKYK